MDKIDIRRVGRQMVLELEPITMDLVWRQLRDDAWHGKEYACISDDSVRLFNRWDELGYFNYSR